MPIGEFEAEVLRQIAANRNPESFVAGATVLNYSPASPRASRDVDIFHDAEKQLAEAAKRDIATLQAAGFEVDLRTAQDTFYRAFVRKGECLTKIEWVFDSAFRFFPVEPDPQLGWRLNFWDAATNKVLALAGRTEIRDLLDVLHLHQQHLHLGALAWAAAAKDPGFTPESIIEWGRRNSRFHPEDLAQIRLTRPVDLRQIKGDWLEAAESAERLIETLPIPEMGCFYLNPQGQPVCPDPASPGFKSLTRHFGSLKGAWPRIVE